MKYIFLFALVIGVCFSQDNQTIYVNPTFTIVNSTNYKDFTTAFQNANTVCRGFTVCYINLAQGFDYVINQSVSYSAPNQIFINLNAPKNLKVSLLNNSTVSISNQANFYFFNLDFVVPTPYVSVDSVFSVNQAKLTFQASSYNGGSNPLKFVKVQSSGAIALYSFQAYANIQGVGFITATDKSQVSVSLTTFNSLSANSNDTIFDIRDEGLGLNTTFSLFNYLTLKNVTSSVLYASNSLVQINNTAITGLKNPNYVILVDNGILQTLALTMYNIDLSNSLYSSAIYATNSLVGLNGYRCIQVTSLQYPCFFVDFNNTNYNNNDFTNVTIPIQKSYFSSNRITGNNDGVLFIGINGYSKYYFRQIDTLAQTSPVFAGNNQFSGNTYSQPSLQNTAVNVRFSGFFQLIPSILTNNGIISMDDNNIFKVSNIDPSQPLFQSLSIKVTDVLGQAFSNPNQAINLNTNNTQLYLYAPHKNITYNVNQQNQNTSNITQDLILTLRQSTLYQQTYNAPPTSDCAKSKSYFLNQPFSYSYNNQLLNINANPIVDSPSTTWYLLANLNMLQDPTNQIKRIYSNYITQNGQAILVIPLLVSDKKCDGGNTLVCKTGEYIALDETCKPCDSSCLSCTDSGKDKCIQCKDSLLYPQNGRCVCDDSTQVLVNGNCLSASDTLNYLKKIDFTSIRNLTDLQVQYRIALNYAATISPAGYNSSTPSSPCGVNSYCSSNGNCNNGKCVCNNGRSGSLCQYQTSDYADIQTRARDASYSLQQIQQISQVDAPTLQGLLLVLQLITTLSDSLNDQSSAFLSGVVNQTLANANSDPRLISSSEYKNFIQSIDNVLFTSVQVGNQTLKNQSNTLYDNLQQAINLRIRVDQQSLQNYPDIPQQIQSKRLFIQYTNINVTNRNDYNQSVGTNFISLPNNVVSQIRQTSSQYTILRIVQYQYNPQQLNNQFVAQSDLVQLQVYNGYSLQTFNISASNLVNDRIYMKLQQPGQFVNSKCYYYNSQSSLWSQNGIQTGNITSDSQIECKTDKFGLFAASNQTKGTQFGINKNYSLTLLGILVFLFLIFQ